MSWSEYSHFLMIGKMFSLLIDKFPFLAAIANTSFSKFISCQPFHLPFPKPLPWSFVSVKALFPEDFMELSFFRNLSSRNFLLKRSRDWPYYPCNNVKFRPLHPKSQDKISTHFSWVLTKCQKPLFYAGFWFSKIFLKCNLLKLKCLRLQAW